MNGTVWPAHGKAWQCGEHGMSTGNRLELGSRVQLQISDAELAQLPTWQRGIARALRDYGGYVNDTTGDESQWGPSLESAGTYTDFGYADPAASVSPSDDTGDYNHNGEREKWYYLFKRIDWSELRVLAPCDPAAGCDEGPPPVGRPSLAASGSSAARSTRRSARHSRRRGRTPSSALRSHHRHRAPAIGARRLASLRRHARRSSHRASQPAVAAKISPSAGAD